MNRLVLTAACLCALAGCARDEIQPVAQDAKPGTYSNDATFTPFYGEEVVHGRLYLIGKKNTWIAFEQNKEIPPTEMITKIGKGPMVDGKRMTVVVQTLKDEPAVEARLMNTMRARWHLE